MVIVFVPFGLSQSSASEHFPSTSSPVSLVLFLIPVVASQPFCVADIFTLAFHHLLLCHSNEILSGSILGWVSGWN
jgi:hypothetical protein